jgi:hypothetical protein
MTADQFTYWLQGYVELNGKLPTEKEWQSIKDHLQLVFNKVTPPVYLNPRTPTDLLGTAIC